jgi:hypothetical protein
MERFVQYSAYILSLLAHFTDVETEAQKGMAFQVVSSKARVGSHVATKHSYLLLDKCILTI